MYTYELSVNDTGDPEQLKAKTACHRITVFEKPTVLGFPRVWQFRQNLRDVPAVIAKEAAHTFFAPGSPSRQFFPGEIAVLLETASGEGATTFVVVEE